MLWNILDLSHDTYGMVVANSGFWKVSSPVDIEQVSGVLVFIFKFSDRYSTSFRYFDGQTESGKIGLNI